MNSSVEGCLRENGYVIQPIVGDSMMPMLCQATDAVRLTLPQSELTVGDIPLYRRPRGNAYVFHRILAVKKRYYLTRGDNRSLIEKVPKRWVVATMQGYYKDGTYIPATDEAYVEYARKIVTTDERFSKDVSAKIQRKGRFLTALYLLVPAFAVMRIAHPSLFYIPFLLPFFWLIRLFSPIFSKRNRQRMKVAFTLLFRKPS